MNALKQNLRKALESAGLWGFVKYVHPRHHRPVLRLGLAKTAAYLRPDTLAARRLASAHLGVAELRAYEGSWVKALKNCDRAVEAAPDSDRIRVRRAEFLVRAGQQQLGHAHTAARAEKAVACLRSAAKCLERAAREPSVESKALRELLDCYPLLGRWKDFSAVLQRYLELRHNDPEIEFLPDLCARAIGATGWLATFAKKKILLGTKERLVLCAPEGAAVNPAFLSYFRGHIEIVAVPREIEALAARKSAAEKPLAHGLAFDGAPKFIGAVVAEVNHRWEEQKRPPLLTIREEHRTRGWDALKELGLKDGDWWVAVHARDAGYYNEGSRSRESFRNSSIAAYLEAFRLITERGGWVFRMGDASMPPLPKLERVFDYARSPLKSDWLDVFLCSQARFFLGTQSGLAGIPAAFGTPSLIANNAPLMCTAYLPDDVVLPKLLKDRNGRVLTARQMLGEPVSGAIAQYLYDELGLKTVENTAPELRDAVSGMLDQFDASGARRTPAPTELQLRFARLSAEAGLSLSGRVDHSFLSRHRDILGDDS